MNGHRRDPGSPHLAAEPAAVAAWVGDRRVPADVVERRLETVRRGRWAAVLPHPATAEGRQLRRWVTQVVVTEALLGHLATTLGVAAGSAGDTRSADSFAADRAAALELGSIVAAALAASPAARRVYAHVVDGIVAGREEVRAHYDRNQDLFPVPGGTAAFADVEHDIAAELTGVAQRRHFLDWLDGHRARLVRLQPGYEHPADPNNPDATHRH